MGEIVTDLIDALAEADGMEPQDLDYTLHEYIDPDALVRLEEMEGARWSLTFRVSDHQVTVTHESRIIVDGVQYASGE